VPVIKKVSEAVIFMAIGAVLFAANPRVGQSGGVYLFSCTAGFGLQWSETSDKPNLSCLGVGPSSVNADSYSWAQSTAT